jgi:TonB family protein
MYREPVEGEGRYADKVLLLTIAISLSGHLLLGLALQAMGRVTPSMKQAAQTTESTYSAHLVPAKSAPPAILPPERVETGIPPASTFTPAIASHAAPSVADSGAKAASAVAPSYHPSAALTEPPRPLSEISPAYPPNDDFQEGRVVLRILINASGRVDDVSVDHSFPKGIFEQAALDAFRNATFSPGKLFGVAVNSQMRVEVKFTPYNRGGMVNGRLN